MSQIDKKKIGECHKQIKKNNRRLSETDNKIIGECQKQITK